MKILLEMRPAMAGLSGIPQETRLLFRGLAGLDGVQVLGLLQSGNLIVENGLPLKRGVEAEGLPAASRIDKLSKVVVSLQQGPASHVFEHLRKKAYRWGWPFVGAAGAALGVKVPLTGFDPTHFKDFVWRSLFALSLPFEDFDAVTSGDFRVMRWPWSLVNALGVTTGVLGHALFPRIETSGLDVFIAQTPYPGRVTGRTRLIVRYHDAIPILMPHTIKDRGYHRAQHFHALKRNARDGAWFACDSDATRGDLVSIVPEVEARAVTIPPIVAPAFHHEMTGAERVPEVIWSRKNRQAPHAGGVAVQQDDLVDGVLPYLLMVSTLEPRKNHLTLLDAWERLRAERFPKLSLVCVGSFGWQHDAILARFAPWLHRGGVHVLEGVPADDLRLLYRHAAVTVCPSLAEGFDYSGIEAMRCGGVVAASDIQVHLDVYAGAAAYFSPYSSRALAGCVGALLGPEASLRCQTLRDEGARVASQFVSDRVMPAWRELLAKVSA